MAACRPRAVAPPVEPPPPVTPDTPVAQVAPPVADDTPDANGYTRLHHAALEGEDVGKLIAGGADVNARTHDGSTALHYAAEFKHVDTVRALLAAHADPNARNAEGET